MGPDPLGIPMFGEAAGTRSTGTGNTPPIGGGITFDSAAAAAAAATVAAAAAAADAAAADAAAADAAAAADGILQHLWPQLALSTQVCLHGIYVDMKQYDGDD